MRALGLVAAVFCLVASISACGKDEAAVSPSTASSTTEARCPDLPVVVADDDIPAGTTVAAAIAGGMLREDVIPAEYRPASAITSLDDAAEGVVVADIVANQIVSFEHLGLQPGTASTAAPSSCSSRGSTTTTNG